jgi:Rrf2 family protein
MQITHKGDYALKAILYLSLHHNDNGGLATIHEMAKHLDIPFKFLEQVLLDLKRGGFVESRRGKVGGYLLAKPPAQIKLGEVIRFIDGPIGPIACIEDRYSGCNDIYGCVFRKVWQEITRLTCEVVDNIDFEDLVERTKKQKAGVIYQI